MRGHWPIRFHGWRALPAPAALGSFVAVLGVLPYLMFAREEGSTKAFKSAFDEDTYLLNDKSTPYRFLSDVVVDAIDFLTPGVAGLLIAADVVIPALAVAAAWLLVSQLVAATALRVLFVLLLLVGQELFSLGNSIVWPEREIVTLRELSPPTTSKLFPDATTSYFSLFRTPEPAVSWVLLFGFLALVSDRDPLRAFEGRRRYLTYPLAALLGFAYPFSAIPIVLIIAILLAWSLIRDRSRAYGVGGALLLATLSFLLAMLVSTIGDRASGASVVFESRFPILTPALAAGTVIVLLFLLVHRTDVLRRPQLLVPFAAALLPIAIGNQQLLTGIMISARDWERYTNYPLIIFALFGFVVSSRDHRIGSALKFRKNLVLGGAWVIVVCLAVQLVRWQLDVYRAWAPINQEAHATAELLDGLTERVSEYPVVLESAHLAPLVRVLTGDRYAHVLDYTRLFDEPPPSFGDGAPPDQAGPHRGDLFAHAFRLGWDPARLEEQLRSELEGDAGGFFSHFVFALPDVWPAVTDDRRLRIDEALQRLPSVVAAYSEYVERQAERSPASVLVVSRGTPGDVGDGRANELIASARPPEGATGPLIVYLQLFDR